MLKTKKSQRKLKREERKENRKPFKETAVGVFLKEKAPDLLGNSVAAVGEFFNLSALERLGENIAGSDELSAADKGHALKLLEYEMQEMQEITKRWESDNLSSERLPKLVRPAILIVTWAILVLVIILNFFGITVDSNYMTIYEVLALTVNGAYFSARTIEKYHSKKLK